MNMQSHPTRVRGLKQCRRHDDGRNGEVAPYTGAWIETAIQLVFAASVAPHAGAQIETQCDLTVPLC